MKIFLFSLMLVLNVSNIFSQENNTSKVNKSILDAIYYQDYVNFLSDKPGLSKVDVFIQVPYKNVQFVKSSQGFTAKYSITASVFDSTKKKLIVEKTWNETVNVMDYNLATSKDNYNLSKRSFDLTPGVYIIRTMLQDKDSKQEAIGENLFIVKTYKDNILLSDILFVSNSDLNQRKNEIIPNVSRNIPSAKQRIKFYFEVYVLDTLGTRNTIEYSVVNSDNLTIHKEVEDRDLKTGVTKIVYTLKEFPFELGVYTLIVSVLDSNQTVLTKTTKSFYSHWKGLPSVITDIDKAIAQTVYIANPDEMEFMEDGENTKEKTKRFLDYWKKKDPSPNNEENEIFDEYFRRIAYSNENFSNYIEGWRSDRGMVYTILGSPNNIDRHPFEYDSKPYEVWEYYDLNRSFIFLDQTGFGDYRLVTPLSGDLYRYRY